MRWLFVAIAVLVCGPRASEADPDPWAGKARPFTPPPLAGPSPEIGSGTPIPLPPIPSFELPPSDPGFPNPLELLVRGRKLLGTEVKATGYITWIYDCATDIGRPGEPRAKTQRRMDDDPTLCERPKFYLGTARDTAPDRSIWVVDVPRLPNKLERERLPKEELAARPKPPKLAVGDFVTVTGTWALASPHSERNSDGLLIFAAIEPAKPRPPATPGATLPPRVRPALSAVSIQPITPKPVDAPTHRSSIDHSNRGTKAYGMKQYDAAIAEYDAAIAAWGGNHVAWYGQAGAHIGRKDWARASESMRHAVELAPNEAMYHMILGYTLYEATVAQAREDQARKQGRKPEEIAVDLSSVSFDKAAQHLAHAVKLEPRLWRAHYYLGRIYRDQDQARWAAEELDTALRTGQPSDPGPWVALAELYRRWQYRDQAIALALAATTVVSGESDVWFELGMAYDDNKKTKQAIEAFTKALELRPDNHKAMFQRGQDYFRERDHKKAKRDLEDFVKAGSSGVAFAQQQANRMLMDIAAKRR